MTSQASQAETFRRDRRLYDVRRGVVYLRRTDHLAQRQWRHFGAVPPITTHVIREVGLSTRLSHTHEGASADGSSEKVEKKERRKERGSSFDNAQSGSEAASAERHCGEAADSKSQRRHNIVENVTVLSQPHISVAPSHNSSVGASQAPRVSKRQANSLDSTTSGDPVLSLTLSTTRRTASSLESDALEAGLNPHAFPSEEMHQRGRETFGVSEDPFGAAHFDTWGSRDWNLDSRLDLDPASKSHTPKHYPPMSRAAGAGLSRKGARRRHLRTLTDFRSQNGIVRIIRPLPPIADTKTKSRFSSGTGAATAEEEEEALELAGLGREHTYAMLKRIDRLLYPTQAFFPSPDLASSQREVRSSSPTCISSLSKEVKESQWEGTEESQMLHRRGEEEGERLVSEGLHRFPGSEPGQHAYLDRIQRRLDHFYGHPGGRPGDSTHSIHGSPESWRVKDRPFVQTPSYPQVQQPPLGQQDLRVGISHPDQDGGRNGCADEDESRLNREENPACRLIPPVKTSHSTCKGNNGEGCSDSHSYSSRTGNQQKDSRGKLGRGWSWRSLSEVVAQLEREGLDLHLKCQDWVRSSHFSPEHQ